MSAGRNPGSEESSADPGEGRLVSYLAELRADPPASDEALVGRVRRSARWQQAIRGPLKVVGHLTGALVDGIGTLLGERRRPGR